MNLTLPFRVLLTCIFCFVAMVGFSQSMVVSQLEVTGNKSTKEWVVLREVPLALGDTVAMSDTASLKAQIKQNLTNTSLFNFVYVEVSMLDSTHSMWEVKVDERWYIWPGIIFQLTETNFNSWWANKDFDRINYGLFIQHYNFRGRREKLTAIFQNGWKRKFGIDYQVPGLNKARTVGAGIEASYANNREISYGSLNNERLFFENQTFIQEEYSAIGRIELRPGYNNTHSFRIGAQRIVLGDTVLDYTRSYLPNGNTSTDFIVLSYGFKREQRDNRAYPLKGYVIDGVVEQEGLGLLENNGVELTVGKITLAQFIPLKDRLYFGHGVKGQYTLRGEPPYYLQGGVGYSNTPLRGYELLVIDGQHHLIYKSNLKYHLIKKKTIDMSLPFLDRFDKFFYSVFLNVFADAGYSVDNINAATNPLANQWLYSAGFGLDLVTYYDVVVRFETSINRQGRVQFNIHFKNAI